MDDVFLNQGLNKEVDNNGVMERTYEKDPTLWVDLQEMLFLISIQGCLYKKILKKLGKTQPVIR